MPQQNVVQVGSANGSHAAQVAKVNGKGGKPAPKPAKAAKPAKGGGRRGGGAPVDPLAQLAQQQVSQAEMPIEQQIQAEKAANLAKAQAQMGFAKAAAAIMQQAAPAVQNAYTGAANSDAGYARALGNAVQAPVDQSVQQNNQFLSQMGAPSGALSNAAPVGDIAYGLQGYIPATSLQREGAAWESAAQMAPADQLAAGQQQATATLTGPDAALNSLNTDLAKIAATEPSVYNHLVNTANTQAYHNAEIGLGRGRLALASQLGYGRLAQGQQRLNLTAQRDAVLAQQGAARINLEGARLQFSIQQAAKHNAQAWARIGIENRRLRMAAAKNQAKLNTGGFTPDELVHIKATAANMATALHNGVPATSTKAALPAVKSYKQAMSYMVSHGIPPTIAMSELKTAGYQVPRNLSSPAAGGGGSFLDGIGKAASAPFGGAVASGAAARIVGLAHEYLGTPYVWGGESPKGFDCSGFAQYLYGKAGISIPRTTYTQWTAPNGHAVSQKNLMPGDLVFFRGSDSRGGLPGHVGVYIGDGMMIDAPHTGASVRIESVYNFGGYMGARRYGRG